MINIPATTTLQPQFDGNIYSFPSESTSLVKLDLLFEAGSAYQTKPLAAAAANKLLVTATRRMDSSRLAEFLDYRGVVVETNNDVLQSTVTVYFLRRFAEDVIPLVSQMLCEPAYDPRDFEVWKERKRQEIATLEQQPAHQARRFFYQTLFGTDHPLGRYARPDDADSLSLEAVKKHYCRTYDILPCTLVLAGNIDDRILSLLSTIDCHLSTYNSQLPIPNGLANGGSNKIKVAGGVCQSSLRVGRVLPLRWEDPDYARFMILTTLLGGWFGSRLMSNLRENKGYTYGIYARTQIYRGVIVFYITADVAVDAADTALVEIDRELKRLCDEPVSDDELELVKTVLTADFIRSVDGVFERSERFCNMLATSLDERFTDNLRIALSDTTPASLQELARRLLAPSSMFHIVAGAY